MCDYEIENETLVMYALKNNNGDYFGSFGTLKTAILYDDIDTVKNIQKFKPEYSEIRKVKIIDIGEFK